MADVQVTIGAQLNELKQGLDQAGTLVKNFKEQANKAREAANFFSQSISAIGGASSQAASLAGNLIGAFAMGGPMGLAIGGVNLLISHLKESAEAAKKAAEESKKWTEGMKKDVDALNERIALFKAELAGGALGVAHYKADKERATAIDEAAKATERRLAAERELARIQAENILLLEAGAGAVDEAPAAQKVKEAIERERLAVEKVTKTIEATEGDLQKAREAHGKAATATAQAEAERLNKANEALERQATAAFQAAAGHKDLNAELQRQAEIIAAQNNRDFETHAREAKKDLLGGPVQFAGGLHEQDYGERRLEQTQREADAAQAATERAQQAIEDFAASAAPLGQAFGGVFASIASGGKNMANVWKNASKQVVQAVFQMVSKNIAAHAAGAAAGAAESQAGIPIVGPGLAVAAMGAMMAAVMALMDSMPSAAGGWLVPDNINPITQLHAGERVIPARYADGLDRMVLDGGKSSGGSTFIIQTMDATGFGEFLERQADVVIRKQREWERDRRY